MKKITRLSESDISRIVKRVINEGMNYNSLRPCKPGDKGTLVQQGSIFALSSGTPFCKVVSGSSTHSGGGGTRPSTTGGGGTRPSTTGGGGTPQPK
jgi:hypothetical protein